MVIPVLSLLGHGASRIRRSSPGRARSAWTTPCRLAADAPQWVRILTHPVTGMVLTGGHLPALETTATISCRPGTADVGSPSATGHQTAPRSTTPSTGTTAAKPDPTTWNACAKATTCSNTTPPGKCDKSPRVLEWTSPLGQNHHRPPRQRHPRQHPRRTLLQRSNTRRSSADSRPRSQGSAALRALERAGVDHDPGQQHAHDAERHERPDAATTGAQSRRPRSTAFPTHRR